MKEKNIMTQRRTRRTYSKKQLVELFNHGKPRSEIVREYDLTASAFGKCGKGSIQLVPAMRKGADILQAVLARPKTAGK